MRNGCFPSENDQDRVELLMGVHPEMAASPVPTTRAGVEMLMDVHAEWLVSL
jgi:hypothetical protein